MAGRVKEVRFEGIKICSTCGGETKWLSAKGDNCWDCTVQAAKEKVPLVIDLDEGVYYDPLAEAVGW